MTELPNQVRKTAAQTLGGYGAIVLFIFALAAFVIQSSLTQYVQGALGFRQPFFLLYVAHSSFIVIFPCHLFYLVVTSRRPVRSYIHSIKAAVVDRFSSLKHRDSLPGPFPTTNFVGIIFALTVGINIPGLLWYASVSLTSIGDITAIWNTNSFWVYVLTVKLYHMKWQPWKLCAVAIACFGVMLDVYGGSKASQPSKGTVVFATPETGPTAPLLGDALTLVASLSYALYQVLYKRYVALPSSSEVDEYGTDSFSYESLSEASTPSLSLASRDVSHDDNKELPFGLYYNLLTSCIGLCTFTTLALGLPVLHWLSIERFVLPSNMRTIGCILAIATSGVVFNSCFMILLGLWGPILTSVGNLLTIVLVLIADFVFNGESITIWSLLGSGMIVAAFGVLVFDVVHHLK